MSRRPGRWSSEGPVASPLGSPTPLLPQRAFVVHLRDGGSSGAAGAAMAGRVEHVVSGRIAEFASLADLRRFMARMAGRDDRDCPVTAPAQARQAAEVSDESPPNNH